MLAYLFIFDYPLLTPMVAAGLVFAFSLVADRKLRLSSRLGVAMFFSVASFIVVFGGMASFLFHDGILPDDPQTHGWQAVVSFCRAFLLTFVLASICCTLGFVVRHRAKKRLLHENHVA